MNIKSSTAAMLVALTLATTGALGADRVKVGFLSTLSGPGGALGIDIRDGFNLAVKHAGGKLGNLPLELTIVDDQQKPDVGKQAAERMVAQNKIDFMTGVVFSNILLPLAPSVLDSKVFYISPNTGPEDYAGSKCNPYFFVASWQNEDIPGAMGKYATEKGYKNVYLIGANYPGGKESLAGFKRYFKGAVADEVYTPMGQLDYAPELAAMQAKKPDALFIFLPGGMGINFIKQFVGSGASKTVALLLPGFSADEDTIKPVGAALVGALNSSHWAHDLDNPQNKRFVADFEKEYGRLPSMYAAQGYDTAMLMDAAIRDVGGNIEDKAAVRKALQNANFKSVRGAFRFNDNHYPVQDYYLREVIKDDKGRITNRTVSKVMTGQADPFVAQCRMPA
ncbi:MAG: ABC transporter substrate-binding protein [Betaproteobacteria bacterium]